MRILARIMHHSNSIFGATMLRLPLLAHKKTSLNTTKLFTVLRQLMTLFSNMRASTFPPLHDSCLSTLSPSTMLSFLRRCRRLLLPQRTQRDTSQKCEVSSLLLPGSLVSPLPRSEKAPQHGCYAKGTQKIRRSCLSSRSLKILWFIKLNLQETWKSLRCIAHVFVPFIRLLY